jgi:hypothetical protein
MRLYGIVPNDLPDNENNGYQIIDALVALASKNDFIYPLTTNGTILNVAIKLSSMKNGEFIVCLATTNRTTETQITGLGAGTFTVAYSGSFKANEYVRVIKTSGGVSIIRLADALSLDSMVSDFLYLKKASQVEEDAGTIDTKATTPLTNLTAFVKRVIGADSGNYLATQSRNGLLSKEDKIKIDNESLIVVTSGNDIEVTSSQGGALQNNFNFNYVDVFPPVGKTMANLKGFMVSNAESWIYGDANDDSWCKYQIQAGKIRAICGCTAPQLAFHLNWLAIWI